MKKILFVMNTMGGAGAEAALLELLRRFPKKDYEIDLYVLMGQGELVEELPERVRLLNHTYRNASVLSKEGKKYLYGTVLKALMKRGNGLRLLPYLLSNLTEMVKKKQIMADKLLWRVISESGERFETHYDLAVAFLEGGAAYYVAEHVHAHKKAVFLHVDYEKAGYTRKLDKDCYLVFDKIFTVSNEVREAFLRVYPECHEKTEIFHNMLDIQGIRTKAQAAGGFEDDFKGFRILTVGRLTAQKALEISIDAMKILKEKRINARWYVCGEGDQRSFLEERIRKADLEEDFVLLGAVRNPYPYMRQADVYVHASRFEGKSIAIQEAQVLGKAILVSDCSGNREQVIPGVDGFMCQLDAGEIAEGIETLLNHEELRERLGKEAAKKISVKSEDINKLLDLL